MQKTLFSLRKGNIPLRNLDTDTLPRRRPIVPAACADESDARRDAAADRRSSASSGLPRRAGRARKKFTSARVVGEKNKRETHRFEVLGELKAALGDGVER